MEVEIDYNGKKEIVVMRTLSWGENNECVRTGMKTNPDGTTKLDFVLQQEHKLLKSIEKAPFEVTLENLRDLSAMDGDKLFNGMMKLNQVSSDVAKNSETPLEVKETSVEK